MCVRACVCLYTYIHMYEKCSDKFTCLVLYRGDRSIHSAFSVDLYCFTKRPKVGR